jgi:hypothetical protein
MIFVEVVDHTSEMMIVLANSLVFCHILSTCYDLKRFHVEVVFQWEMYIDFTGSN